MERTERHITDSGVEIREEADGQKYLEGYAAVFNSWSKDLGGFREIIRPGAFKNALKEKQDVSARIQHEGGLSTIGRTTNGTLTLKEDRKGLRYRVKLPNTTAGRDIHELVSDGTIDKSSFAFSVREHGEKWDFSIEPVERELTDLDLYDVAPVDGPAYEGTSVKARQHVLEEARSRQEADAAEPPLDKAEEADDNTDKVGDEVLPPGDRIAGRIAAKQEFLRRLQPK